ncbi:dimethylaniline monooxygenase [N-oxide-forming] 2-like [Dendrobates tinctorius]|uniref:dimethylaniline monooxygenase [N-oxide-forming] 2-like n=1 Tax=Dendrobates tinctorius TaxID=92724 RepID=UPI003CC9C1C4
MLPAPVSRWMLKKYLNDHFNHELYNIQPEGIAWKEPLVNDELPSRILSGSIMIKPHVAKFTETSVHFADGSVVDNLDMVLLTTGYDYSFPFLDEVIVKKDESKGSFYKKIIPLGIEKPTIAFIAFVLAIGPTMVLAELQSRWATRLFKGLHKLPCNEEIKNEMLKDERLRKKWFATADDNFRRTDYIWYLDDLASDIGVKPNIWKLFLTDPVLAWKLVFGPCNSYQFRLTGPAKWSGAREAILTQWDRIKKPLRTRVIKQNPESHWITFLPWIICLFILILAFFLRA